MNKFTVSQGRRERTEFDRGPSTVSPAMLATCCIWRVSSSTVAPSSDSASMTPSILLPSTTGNWVRL